MSCKRHSRLHTLVLGSLPKRSVPKTWRDSEGIAMGAAKVESAPTAAAIPNEAADSRAKPNRLNRP